MTFRGLARHVSGVSGTLDTAPAIGSCHPAVHGRVTTVARCRGRRTEAGNRGHEPSDLRLVLRGHGGVAGRRLPLRRRARALILCAILGILEISLSFDNAVVNATVLERMSEFWQRIFLTDRHPDRRVRHAAGVPAGHRGGHGRAQPGRGAHPGAGAAPGERPDQLRRTCSTRPTRRSPRSAACSCSCCSSTGSSRTASIKWLTWLERPLARIGQLNRLSVVLAVRRAGRAGQHPRRGPGRRADRRRRSAWSPTSLVNGLGELLRAGRPTTSWRRSRRQARLGQRVGPVRAGEGHRQGRLLPVPLPRGARRLVLLRRRDRRVRHHHRPDPHRAGPRPDRRDVRPVAHRVPGAQGHAGRLRLPRARRALGDRRAGGDPAGRHRLPRQRDHHRADRGRVHRCGVPVQHPAQPQAGRRGHRDAQDGRGTGRRPAATSDQFHVYEVGTRDRQHDQGPEGVAGQARRRHPDPGPDGPGLGRGEEARPVRLEVPVHRPRRLGAAVRRRAATSSTPCGSGSCAARTAPCSTPATTSPARARATTSRSSST